MLLSQRLVTLALFTWIFAAVSAAASSKEAFTEELLVVPLPDGKALTHFQFTTQWQVDARKSKNDCKLIEYFTLKKFDYRRIIHL